MKFLLAALMLVSTTAFANEIIRIEGGNATCNNMSDVLLHQTSGIYRPVSLTQNGENVNLTVEFLKCVQKDGKFAMVRDRHFESQTVTVAPGPLHREEIVVDIARTQIQAVTFNTSGRTYSRNEMQRHSDSTYSQKLPVGTIDALETDRNGDRFFEMAVSYQVEVKNSATGRVIDNKREWLGSYRVYVK